MSQHNGEYMSQEEQLEEQEAMQTRQGALQDARDLGRQSGDLQQLFDDEDLLEMLLDPDITRDDEDELQDALMPQFSRVYQTSNLNAHEVQKMQIWTDSEAQLKSHEYPDRDSAATGTRGQIMYGAATPAELSDADLDERSREQLRVKPPLTDEQEGRIWGAADTKKALLTRSKGGWLIRRFTEFVAVGVNERRTKDDDESGFLSRIKRRLV